MYVCMYTQFRANYKSAKADFLHVGSQIHGECRDGGRRSWIVELIGGVVAELWPNNSRSRQNLKCQKFCLSTLHSFFYKQLTISNRASNRPNIKQHLSNRGWKPELHNRKWMNIIATQSIVLDTCFRFLQQNRIFKKILSLFGLETCYTIIFHIWGMGGV